MGRTVLVVDDSPIFRKILKSCFPPEAGFAVHEAGDGKAGVEAYLEHRPDIVFMDLTMPVMDGVAALERIREMNPEAVVIVSTADVQPKSIERVMGLGALTVLKKPPTKERMAEVLALAETRLEARP